MLCDGRVDVGLRCVSCALFRSQSLRQNARVLLCFGVPEAAEAGAGTAGPRVVEVDGIPQGRRIPDYEGAGSGDWFAR